LKRVHDDPIILIKNGSMNIKPSEKKSGDVYSHLCASLPVTASLPKTAEKAKETKKDSPKSKHSKNITRLLNVADWTTALANVNR